MSWTNLDNNAHTRLWEHLNNLWNAVLGIVPASTRVVKTTDSTTGGAYTVVFDSESWDNSTPEMHTAGAPDRVQIRTAGKYIVHGMVTLNSNANIQPTLALCKNGTPWLTMLVSVDNTKVVDLAFTDEQAFAVGDYITLQVTALTGGTLGILGTKQCHMNVRRISA